MFSQVRRENSLSVLVSGDGEQAGTSGWPVVVVVLRRIVSARGTEGHPARTELRVPVREIGRAESRRYETGNVAVRRQISITALVREKPVPTSCRPVRPPLRRVARSRNTGHYFRAKGGVLGGYEDTEAGFCAIS